MIAVAAPGNGDFTEAGAEIPAEQRGGKPAGDDEQRPFERVAVPVEPEPDPHEVGKAVTHTQPEQKPEGIGPGDGAGTKELIEDSVVHGEVEQAAQKAENRGGVPLQHEKRHGQEKEKADVEVDIQSVEHTGGYDFAHRFRLLCVFVGDRAESWLLVYHKSKQTTFVGGMTVPRPAAAGSFDGTIFSVTESAAFR